MMKSAFVHTMNREDKESASVSLCACERERESIRSVSLLRIETENS